MDEHFLEFWGNFLLNAAKGKRQLEEMPKWMHQGFRGFEDLGGMFRKFYGLDVLAEDSPDYLERWRKAEEDFRKSFRDYLSLLGVVPREEHVRLVKKYEELKDKVSSQEETIQHLQILLGEKGFDHGGEVIRGFQDLVKEQSDQFRELVEGFGELFRREDDES